MTWKFVLANTDGSLIDELRWATRRSYIAKVDDFHQASFDIDGRIPMAHRISEMETDLIVYQDGHKRFRGRIGPSNDNFDAAKFDVSFKAVDYRGILARRFLWPTSTLLGSAPAFGLVWNLTGQEQTAIAWGLVDATQTTPPQSDPTNTGSSSLGISAGRLPVTGVVRDRQYFVSDSVGSALDDLGRVIGGYEWEIDANLAMNIYYPQRGSNTGKVLYFSGNSSANNILSGQRTVATDQFSNAQLETGGHSSSYVAGVAEVDASQFATIGRWEAVETGTSITDHASAAAKAQGNLNASGDIDPSYSLVLKPGWWTPDVLWLGDTTRLVVKHGRLNVDTPQRVSQVQVDLSDDIEGDNAKVTLSTGPFIPKLADIVRQSKVRLDRVYTR